MSVTPSQVTRIAERVAELLDSRTVEPFGDVRTVARELGVQEYWVYENARRLGGVKLGPGKGARWRFDMARMRRLVASGALESEGEPQLEGRPLPSAGEAAPRPQPPRPAPKPKGRPPEGGFDDAPHAMARLDLTGRFTAVNPAFAKLVGYSEEEFAKARWPSPHDREEFAGQSAALRSLAAGDADEILFRSSYLHGQGLIVQIHGRLRLVRGEGGAPDHLLLVAER